MCSDRPLEEQSSYSLCEILCLTRRTSHETTMTTRIEEMTSVSDNRPEETLACSFERSFQFLSSEQEAGEALMLLKRLVKARVCPFSGTFTLH